ncbi:helicase [Rhizobium lentis]|uniref:type ISP restriction/modification enzyme n=1 Tax=Rhizobium lentis TaxID=1138194 RepID=UPI001C8349DB|nr:type ISP restriction/modification enzyme [Rhizobium lentis]MBX4959523.1 helicase [Rhizobium lentis]
MQNISEVLIEYNSETRRLDTLPSSTENTFYPSIKVLIAAILKDCKLPFEVRVNTSEARAKARDMPDFVLGDDKLFVGVFGEVKRPVVTLQDIANSTEQKDQIGRYLAQTGVVIVCNVRGFGLLACEPGYERPVTGTVPPERRQLIKTVDLWSATTGIGKHAKIDNVAIAGLREIIERAVTDYAPLAEPSDLAKVLARQARDAKDALPSDLKPVKPLLDDYRQALGLSFNVDDERGDRFFRSSLVQTAFYSLFAAWVLWDKAGAPDDHFDIEDAHKYLPIPFLDALLHDIRHPKRLKALGLEAHLARAIATLNRVDRPLFRARMTFPTIDEQTSTAAITYFYEPFLEAFDPKLREELGVWYTPPQIVRYQVRRVHHLLKTELDRPLGLADPEIIVLDPCCGTYLLEVARCIAEETRSVGDDAAIGLELARAFQERVIGFEILTAPFAVAQLQLYLLLESLGAKPPADKRLSIFLTNALSGWHDTGDVKLSFPEMREEFDASQEVKRKAKVIVVIGNPPYDAFAGVAQAQEAQLVAHYKGTELIDDIDSRTKQVKRDEFGNPKMKQRGTGALYLEYGVRKQLLDDLYIRFFRMAEERIGEAAEYGIVSLISNSSYLTGRSHPIMRKSLLSNFHDIWIDNLNGDKYRTGKLIPPGLPNAGKADQSAFSTDMDPRGIQPGTAIITLMKRADTNSEPTRANVQYRDFWGLANNKRSGLIASLPTGIGASSPSYTPISPSRESRWRLSPTMVEGGFEEWPALDELFPTSYQGVEPSRGLTGTVIDSDQSSLHKRIESYLSAPTFEVAATMHPAFLEEFARYDPKKEWETAAKIGFHKEKIVKDLIFPFDQRFIYYEVEGKWLNESRPEFEQNLTKNEFFITVPEPRKLSESRPVYSSTLVNRHVHERGSVVFPRQVKDSLAGEAYANLTNNVWKTLGMHFGLTEQQVATSGASVRPLTVSRDSEVARDFTGKLFRVAFAILHAPAYQAEHKSSLSADWAHLPIPKDAKVFDALAHKGEQVVRLLDANRDALDIVKAILGSERTTAIGPMRRDDDGHLQPDDLKVSVTYWGGGKGRWKPHPFGVADTPDPAWGDGVWGQRTGDLYINDNAFFANVPEAVWTYQLGGYPVLKKWLGYRQAKRRNDEALTNDERKWFRQIIQRIAALLALGHELDTLYQQAASDAFTTTELGIER